MPNHHKYLWLGIGLTIWEVLDHRCHHCTQSQHCDKGDTRFLLRSKKQGPISSIKMTHNNIRNRDLITEHLWVDLKNLTMAWAIVDSFVHLLRLLLYNIQDISFYPRSDQVINGIKEVTHALTHVFFKFKAHLFLREVPVPTDRLLDHARTHPHSQRKDTLLYSRIINTTHTRRSRKFVWTN